MKYDLEELLRKMDNAKPSKELNQTVLHNIEEETHMNKRTKPFATHTGKIAAALLAGILATGGIVYAASQLWNQDVAEQFGVKENKETMQELSEQGFAQIPTSTEETPLEIEDQDITVKILQTLADEQSAYIYFEVDYGEQYKVVVDEDQKKDMDKEIPDICVAEPNITFLLNGATKMSQSGGMQEIKNEHTITYAYWIYADEEPFRNETIEMNIDRFDINQLKTDTTKSTTVKGDWKLKWNLSNGTTKRVYTLNKELTINNTTITLKSLELSPLSCKLLIDAKNYDKISNHFFVVKNKKGHFETDENGNYIITRYINLETDSIQLEKNEERLYLASISDLYLGKQTFDGFDGAGSSGDEADEQTFLDTKTFTKILDVDQVTAFRFGGQLISLTDCDYETVTCFND